MELETPEKAERLDTINAYAKLADKAIDRSAWNEVSIEIEGMCNASSTRMRSNARGINFVVQSLARCAIALPIKSPVYATVTGLLTCGSESFSKDLAKHLLEYVAKELQTYLREGKQSLARRAFRFLACLTECRVVSAKSMALTIIELLQTTIGELKQPDDSERWVHCRGVFLVEIALSALPWVSKSLQERVPELLEDIMVRMEQVSHAWEINRWRGVAPASGGRCVPCFSELLDAIRSLRDDRWQVSTDFIPRPQDMFSQLSSGGQELPIGLGTIPAHSKISRYSSPRFRMVFVNPIEETSVQAMDTTTDEAATQFQQSENGTQAFATPVNEEKEAPESTKRRKISGSPVSSPKVSPSKTDVKLEEVQEQNIGDSQQQRSQQDTKKEEDLIDFTLQNDTKEGVNISAQSSSGSNLQILADPESQISNPGNSSNLANPSSNTANSPPKDAKTLGPNGTKDDGERDVDPNDMPIVDVASKHRPPAVRYVIRSYIADIIDNFGENHAMAAERLLTFPLFKEESDEIVESVFSQLCATPAPSFPPVYFGTLFVDLCHVKETKLPTNLLTAVNTLFQEAGDLDPDIFDRLTEWFAFHLSNFGYKWNWSDWALYADTDMVEKFPYRALFCKDVLSKCIRLSYYERVTAIVPPEMSYFFPVAPGNGDRSRFKVDTNDELMKIVTGKGKQEAGVVKKRLEELIPLNLAADESSDKEKTEANINLLRLSALTRAILQAGCRTLSHFDIVSERYEDLMREMSIKGGHHARRLVTLEVTSFWKSMHIRKMYVLDKLRARSIIDGQAIIDSCIAYERVKDEMGATERIENKEIMSNLSDSGCWELVRLVLSRAVSREEAARSELQHISERAAAASEGETENLVALLQKSKRSVEKAKNEVAELVLVAERRLFGICAKLLTGTKIDSGDVDMTQGNEERLPGVGGKPIWYWRCTGMMRELARRHPRHLSIIIDQLNIDTLDNRDQHKVLWDSFDIIKEIEGNCMLNRVW